jgi:hypothetical protein
LCGTVANNSKKKEEHMSTPEGKVKKLIRERLEKYEIYTASKAGAFPGGSTGWYYCPMQTAMGISGIPDFLGHYKGIFWAIEAKAPGKKPTGFQALQLGAIKASGGAQFVVDGEVSLEEFENWLGRQ